MRSLSTITVAEVVAALVIAGEIKSTNYDPPDGGEVFADAGTRLNLITGDITSAGLVVTGSSGTVRARNFQVIKAGSSAVLAQFVENLAAAGDAVLQYLQAASTGGGESWAFVGSDDNGGRNLVMQQQTNADTLGDTSTRPRVVLNANAAGNTATATIEAYTESPGSGAQLASLVLQQVAGGLRGTASFPTVRSLTVGQFNVDAELNIHGIDALIALRDHIGGSNWNQISWYNSAGTRHAYFGRNALDFYLTHEQAGGHLRLYTSADFTISSDNVPQLVSNFGATGIGPLRAARTVQARSNATVALTTGGVAMPGAEVTFTEARAAGCDVLVIGTYDFDVAALGGGAAVGYLVVDAVNQTGYAIHVGAGVGDRATVVQTWVLTLSVGTHTLDLRAFKTAAGGTINAQAIHTSIAVLRLS